MSNTQINTKIIPIITEEDYNLFRHYDGMKGGIVDDIDTQILTLMYYGHVKLKVLAFLLSMSKQAVSLRMQKLLKLGWVESKIRESRADNAYVLSTMAKEAMTDIGINGRRMNLYSIIFRDSHNLLDRDDGGNI